MPKLRKRFAAILAAILIACMAVPLAIADMHGIDVSGWQTPNVTCTASYDFAVVKATQGTGFTNGYMTRQAQCVRQRGKSLGFYHYAGGGNPTAEADYFVNTVRPYIGQAVLVLDWESYQNAAWGNSNWVRVFVNRVHDRTGVWPIVYVSAAYIYQIPSDVRRNCGLWVAQYANNNPTGYQSRPWNYGRYGEAMRQYTSSGRINGYNGPLDLNYFRGTREQWNKYANPNNTATTPAPTPTPTPAPQPAPKPAGGYSVVVRSGDTISGIAMRTGLWPVTAWSVPSGDINRIWPGQTVRYTGTATTASNAGTGTRIHVVRRGETLSGIFGAAGWQRVAQLNNLSNPNLIFPGQQLRY
ncbi:GH25 family lysozyme [Bifidobacterium oedipodis]|uniref:Glycoside hydrolase n=1 Tax=Bifidobacterium oedipodis TaxID=2675322 RepID=A0A7Y0ENE1_9BIFI|nr:GH25 family lysozyme [Bifidobacterium sp. DSM 109957]NMM93494.1 glycoside hydrolase [Bifidobacterium sp. DSM 109957]